MRNTIILILFALVNNILCSQSFTDEINLYYPGRPLISTFSTNQIPSDFVLSDINNDGLSDIIISSSGEYAAFYKLNLGDNKFSHNKLIAPDLKYVLSIKSEDLNNDGVNDIVLVKSDSLMGLNDFGIPTNINQTISIVYNDGLGNFGDEIELFSFLYNSIPQISLFDVNLDGLNDIFFLNKVLLNQNSNFSGPINFTNPDFKKCEFEDLNQDGIKDMIKIYANQTMVFFAGDGELFASDSLLLPYNITSVFTAYGDIDNDGDVDFLGLPSGGVLKKFENIGSFNFLMSDLNIANPIIFSGSGQFGFVEINDLNNDGFNDLFAFQNENNTQVTIYFGNSAGQLTNQSVYNFNEDFLPRKYIINDIDTNGTKDLICFDNSKYFVCSKRDLLNQETGVEEIYGIDYPYNVINFNGDNYSDFEFIHINNNQNDYIDKISLILGNEDNTYNFGRYEACQDSCFPYTGSQINSHFFAKINNDNLEDKLDIRSESNGFRVKAYINNGNGFYTDSSEFFLPIYNQILTNYNPFNVFYYKSFFSSFVNADIHLFTFRDSFGDFYLLANKYSYNNGFEHLLQGKLDFFDCNVPQYFNILDWKDNNSNIDLIDFDSDDDFDVIYRTSVTDNVAQTNCDTKIVVLENVNNSTFNLMGSYNIDSYDSIYVADYDSIFTYRCNIRGYAGSFVRDFNNDGVYDLVANFTDCSNAFFAFFPGTQNFQFGDPIILETPFKDISGIQIIDLNHDGFLDILFTSMDSACALGYFINQGDFYFQPWVSITSNKYGFEGLILKDCDNDMDLDIYAYRYGDGKVSLFKNKDFTVGIEKLHENVQVFPNPTRNLLFIKGINTSNLNYSIFDLNQKLVKEGINQTDNSIDIGDLLNGVYILKVISKESIFTSKIIKLN